MREFVLALCVALAVVASTARASAQGAELRPIRGEILVNAGDGYRAIAAAEQLRPGDAAVASPGALGRLTYADGCSVDVVSGSVTWVLRHPPCQADAATPPPRDPAPVVAPRMALDPTWLVDGAASIDRRRPPAGP